MQEIKYQPLTIPKLHWEQSSSPESFGELIVQPLEPGFGVTLGNSLRRVLLSSVEGSAATSVIIKGTNNEFSAIRGVEEDVLHVSLNIKELVIKNKTGLPGEMRLSFKGAGVVTAASIEADEHLEVVNKNHVLAHLAADGELDIQFFIEPGRGYEPAKWPAGVPLQEDDRIYLDAMFSPVKRVEFSIKKTRVGQAIDYDELHLQVYTNGAVTPQTVVHYATSVIRTQLEHFLSIAEIPFNDISKIEEKTREEKQRTTGVKNPTKGLPVELFLKPIDELEFSVRAHNCLIGAGIKRVIDLVNLSDEDVLKIKNFGRKSLREVKEILNAFGLQLGMNIKELDLKKIIKEQEESFKS